MNIDKKERIIFKVVDKLKSVAEKTLHIKSYEKCLAAINICASLFKRYNQFYTDEKLERILLDFSNSYVKDVRKKDYCPNRRGKTVLLYDGFGLDLRGCILVLANALCKSDYKVVYVTAVQAKNKQPHLLRLLNGFGANIEYLNELDNTIERVNEFVNIFDKYEPGNAFLYTTPWDVTGISVFNAYSGDVCRYLLDLNDHAFWLGVNAIDYCIGSRDYSQSVAHYYRGISSEKLLLVDANLYIDETISYQGLPFDVNEHRFIFSGGSLYKTLGDSNNTFYKIIEHILQNHKDICFLYAGGGDSREIKKLVKKYDNRVFYIKERPDFWQIMKRCTLYLNTYPMFGGLMMRYAALANKLPLTLKHNHDSDGILMNQADRQIEYDTYDEIVADIDRLLNDSEYLHKREAKLAGSVMTEERYSKNMQMLLDEKKTEFKVKLQKIDTSEFRAEYRIRFSIRKDLLALFASRLGYILKFEFPLLFIAGFACRCLSALKSRLVSKK